MEEEVGAWVELEQAVRRPPVVEIPSHVKAKKPIFVQEYNMLTID